MGTDKEDTDPSSPGALRPSQPSGRAAAAARALSEPRPGQPTTDPGLGPTVGASSCVRPPADVRHRARAVASETRGPNAITPPEMSPIAPPAGRPRPSSIKDSVELLLEGMAGPRPERRKTTPQSDGEASAAYHAEHGVRRARTSEPAPPKVVVERPGRPSARSSAERPALARAGIARGALDVRARPAFFAAAWRWRSSPGASSCCSRSWRSASPTGTPARPLRGRPRRRACRRRLTASPVEAPAATTEIVSMPTIVPTPSAPAAEARADDAPTAPVATGGSTHHRHADTDPARPRAAGDAPASTGDLGEFKSKF